MMECIYLRDPTSESNQEMRTPVAFPKDLSGKTVAMLDISKERSAEFLDYLAAEFTMTDLVVKRFRKESHSKPASVNIIQAIVREADLVIEGLAD